MAHFFFSLIFFFVALALFWGVLHWVRYKKRHDTCACGSGACLTGSHRKHGKNQPAEKTGDHSCDSGSCHCGD